MSVVHQEAGCSLAAVALMYLLKAAFLCLCILSQKGTCSMQARPQAQTLLAATYRYRQSLQSALLLCRTAEPDVPPPLQVGLQKSYVRGDRQSSNCPSTTWSTAVFSHGHAGHPSQWISGSCVAGVSST